MSGCNLLLIRHGETEWNREGRYQGHADPPLSPSGSEQARRVARACAGLELQAVCSSDLRRALQTAAPVAAAHRLPITADPRLRELNFGDWDGRLAQDVIDGNPAAWNAWYADPVQIAPPGGETAEALWQRFYGGALAEIRRRFPRGTVAVITHGGPLRLLLTWVRTGRLHPSGPQSVDNGGWLLLTPGNQIQAGPDQNSEA